MFSPNFKEKLRNGEVCLGTWVTLGHPGIAEIFAKAGFDWIVVDMEHSTITIDQAGELIRVIDAENVSPLVRLTNNDANLIKRVMDAGAHGIVVPNVNNAADAKLAVEATRYPPQGIRGVGLGRAQQYGPGFKDYLEWQREGPIVIIQIEDIVALDCLEEIFATFGVDGFIIGPYDLSCSMGIPGEFDRPEFSIAIEKILKTAIRVGCPAGIHLIEPDLEQLQDSIDNGYRMIAYSVDIRMLDTLARVGVSAIKKVSQ